MINGIFHKGAGNVISDEVFGLIRINIGAYMGYLDTFNLDAQVATCGNFFICINPRWPRIEMLVFLYSNSSCQQYII